MGAAMGWTPADVRACSPADFTAAVDGFLMAQGVEMPDRLSKDDVRELRELLEADE